jgi:hypothetical protein
MFISLAFGAILLGIILMIMASFGILFPLIASPICFLLAIVFVSIDLSKTKENRFSRQFLVALAASFLGMLSKSVLTEYADSALYPGPGQKGPFVYELAFFGIGLWWMAIPLVVLLVAFISAMISIRLAKGKNFCNFWATSITILLSISPSFFGFVYYFSQ